MSCKGLRCATQSHFLKKNTKTFHEDEFHDELNLLTFEVGDDFFWLNCFHYDIFMLLLLRLIQGIQLDHTFLCMCFSMNGILWWLLDKQSSAWCKSYMLLTSSYLSLHYIIRWYVCLTMKLLYLNWFQSNTSDWQSWDKVLGVLQIQYFLRLNC